jgi:hypothetical protein
VATFISTDIVSQISNVILELVTFP